MSRLAQNGGHGEKRSRKEEQAIAALLATSTIPEAAAHSGLSENTLRGWLKDRSFASAYRQARARVLDEATAQIQKATTAAVQTLTAVMADEAAPASARVSAAKEVLATALKVREIDELEARLAALEARIQQGPVTVTFDEYFKQRS